MVSKWWTPVVSGDSTCVFVNRIFTPSETIQILRKFSRPKTLKIYPPVV